MATRGELVKVVGERYRSADRESKGFTLDEPPAVTGFHRKQAMRLLRAQQSAAGDSARGKRRIYDEAARMVLVRAMGDGGSVVRQAAAAAYSDLA